MFDGSGASSVASADGAGVPLAPLGAETDEAREADADESAAAG